MKVIITENYEEMSKKASEIIIGIEKNKPECIRCVAEALADFADYRSKNKLAIELHNDSDRWNRMSLMNIAGAGIFAADRSINDYARDIWHVDPLKLR